MKKLLVVMLISNAALAQSVRLPISFETLGAKASDVVEVSLDGPMLQAAIGALDSKSDTERSARQIASKLTGVYVHQYQFDDGGQVAREERTRIEAQLKAPEWSKIVTTRRKKESETVDVYARQTSTGLSGLVVVSTQKGGLTVVDLIGTLRPEDLNSLSGTFGVPSVEVMMPVTLDAGTAR